MTPHNVKGSILLFNEQPSPVMSLNPYKTPQSAFRNSPQHGTLEAYDKYAPLPPMPRMPEKYYPFSEGLGTIVPNDSLGLNYTLEDAIQVIYKLDPILDVGEQAGPS